MRSVNLIFNNVSFAYDTSSGYIISSLNMHLASGWTGIAGANGTGKTTIAKLAAGLLIPTAGSVTASCDVLSAVYCSQDTEFPPENSAAFIADPENNAGRIRSILGIEDDWLERWNTLSHGERKRFQTGVSLWVNPDILALDEPTNHLDHISKQFIIDALRIYEGTGIIISHDRELLDTLCTSCLFLNPGRWVMRPGGVSSGLQQGEIENKNRERLYSGTRETYMRLKRSAQSLKEKESARSSLSKKNLDRHDHDGKGKIDLARLTGRDKTASRKIRQIEKKRDAMKKSAEDNYFSRRRIEGFEFTGEKYHRHILLHLPEGMISIKSRTIMYPDLVIGRGDRVGITGENGSGKSTMLRHILSSLDIPRKKIIYVPQEISSHELSLLKNELDSLSGTDKGQLLSIIFRLGSEPERILESPFPSPGEARKIMLGLGLLKSPALIVMDEPTNHMDLPSVQRLEQALVQFTGAMIIISHDTRFIGNVSTKRWHIDKEGSCSQLIII